MAAAVFKCRFKDLDLDRVRTQLSHPILFDGRNLFDPAEMKQRGFVGKNYMVGPAAWYWGAYPGKLLSSNPTAKIAEFFKDCKDGTLPPFSIIDPDFWQTTIIQATTCSLGRR